jgi:hypothetical protein
MCVPYREMSRKARLFLAGGNLCLFTGVALGLFNHHAVAHHPDWYDFFRGMLMGLAIVFMFFAARLSRRCAPIR